MFKEKRVNLIFLVINSLLIITSLYFFKVWTFSDIDDWVIKKLYSLYSTNYQVKASDKIVLIKIDKKFFTDLWVTTWTLHRWYYAKALEKLNEWWAKNVVFDVFFWDLNTSKDFKYKYLNKIESRAQKYFNKTIYYFDNKLAKALSWNVVVGAMPYGTWILLPSEKFINAWVWLWYVDSHSTKNYINNWTIAYKKYNNSYILTLWLASYLNRLYVSWIIWKKIDIKLIKWRSFIFDWLKFTPDYILIKTTNPKIKIKVPLSKDTYNKSFLLTRLFFVYPKYTFSLSDVIKNKIKYPESIFDNKTVFIWATDDSLNDIKSSYLWYIPWVSFHMNNFVSAYSNMFCYKSPVWRNFLILLILFLIWYFFVILGKDQFKSFIAFVALSIAVFVWHFILFSTKWILIPVWTILSLFIIKLLIDVVHILMITGLNKEKFKKWFSSYVWEMVLKKKEKSWEVRISERKDVVLMFTDIEWFTNISEKLTATEVTKMLNIYFEKANFLLKKTNVYMDKYIWDAIMAFWEENPDFDLITKKVFLFQKLHWVINADIVNLIGKDVWLKTRIWLHYWEVIAWEIWDSEKMWYTAIWDNVNLASRLEWINKYYWTRIIMSEDFYKNIKDKSKFAIRLIDKITVKWKTKPVKIYELMLFEEKEIWSNLMYYIEIFHSWLDFYFSWNFVEAKKIFEELLKNSLWKNDKTLKIFIERLNYLISNSPKNWTWVWEFTTK